jgi:hypothetical protein
MKGGRPRRSATRVKGGRVQRKNNWGPDLADHRRVEQPFPLVIRERPGPGHRHLLRRRDIHAFLALLPDWEELSRGLNAIVLAVAEDETAGWSDVGTVAICAWEQELWQPLDPEFYEEHREIIARLGVATERRVFEREEFVLVKWTEPAARAYQLLHILLHELGHHHDRMTTPARPDRPPRGEPYAEAYALRYEARIWDDYMDRFGLE